MVIPGFVLAGGRSRRMGTDKAFVPIDGVPMAVRTGRVLQAAGCAPVHLVGRQPKLRELGFPVVSEDAHGHHPLLGVAAALSSLPGGLAIFAPCDLVHLTPTALTALLDVGGPCVAEGPQGLHPLLTVLPVELLADVTRLASEGAPAHTLHIGRPRVRLPGHVLRDINRPVDLPHPAE